MSFLEASFSIPQEIVGGRMSQAATNLALSKKLIADVYTNGKLPTVTICADTTNFYDRVAHPYASLCSKCFGMEIF